MNRREFLRGGRAAPDPGELSCERLYMDYLEAQREGRAREFFEGLERELGRLRRVRLRGVYWLRQDGCRDEFARVLSEFRSRGGTVESV